MKNKPVLVLFCFPLEVKIVETRTEANTNTDTLNSDKT